MYVCILRCSSCKIHLLFSRTHTTQLLVGFIIVNNLRQNSFLDLETETRNQDMTGMNRVLSLKYLLYTYTCTYVYTYIYGSRSLSKTSGISHLLYLTLTEIKKNTKENINTIVAIL